MQIECRTTSLLDCYAEMQLILCKDTRIILILTFWEENIIPFIPQRQHAYDKLFAVGCGAVEVLVAHEDRGRQGLDGTGCTLRKNYRLLHRCTGKREARENEITSQVGRTLQQVCKKTGKPYNPLIIASISLELPHSLNILL